MIQGCRNQKWKESGVRERRRGKRRPGRSGPPRASGPQLQRIVDSAKAFLDAESTITADIKTMIRSLDARPLMTQVPHLLPAEEVDIRLELAAKIRDSHFPNDEDHLTAFDISLIMFVPINTVRRWWSCCPFCSSKSLSPNGRMCAHTVGTGGPDPSRETCPRNKEFCR